MTKLQDKLYWREWGAVSRACRAAELPTPDRHELHAEAGAPESHLKFSNADFDRVLGVFRARSRPSDVAAQLRQEKMPGTRLIHSIRSKADEHYIEAVAHDKFHATDWSSELSVEQLEQLRNTLAARDCSRKRREREQEQEQEAGLCPF